MSVHEQAHHLVSHGFALGRLAQPASERWHQRLINHRPPREPAGGDSARLNVDIRVGES